MFQSVLQGKTRCHNIFMILGFLKNILGTTCYHQYQVTPINDFKLWWYEELLIDYSDKTFTSNRWLLPRAEYDIKIFKTVINVLHSMQLYSDAIFKGI